MTHAESDVLELLAEAGLVGYALVVRRAGSGGGARSGVARHPYLDEGLRARGLAWRELALAGGALQPRRLSAARRDLLAALVLRPRWGEAWADLGWVRFLSCDAASAEEALRRAVALDPTHVGIGVVTFEHQAAFVERWNEYFCR